MNQDFNEDTNPEALSFVNKFKLFEHHSFNNDIPEIRPSLTLRPRSLLKQKNRLSYDSDESLCKYSMDAVDNEKTLSIDISELHISNEDIQVSIDMLDSSNIITASSFPSNKCLSNHIEHVSKREFSSRNLSLRQKKIEKNNFLKYKSLSNTNLEKSVLLQDITISRKITNVNAGSMASLFEEELTKSVKSEYIIDWKAIFLRISEKTANEIEISLISYFHNLNNNLKVFPSTFLYRFLTYDDVLASVFNNILSADFHDNIHDEILSTPTQMDNFDYDMDAYNIIKLTKCNIERLTRLVEEYQERKNNFSLTLDKLKADLDQYLKNPDYSTRMHILIKSICTKLEMMSNIVIIVVELMSRWKLSKEFSHLYQSNEKESLMLENCETTLADLRQSQKKLEQQMVYLIRLFREDKCEEVLKIVDQIFSENIELNLYLPIFKDKLKNDSKVLAFLKTTPIMTSGQEQFV